MMYARDCNSCNRVTTKTSSSHAGFLQHIPFRFVFGGLGHDVEWRVSRDCHHVANDHVAILQTIHSQSSSCISVPRSRSDPMFTGGSLSIYVTFFTALCLFLMRMESTWSPVASPSDPLRVSPQPRHHPPTCLTSSSAPAKSNG